VIRRLIGDTRGVAVVEFAISLPFLVLLYIGGYQLSDAIFAYRKVTYASRALADLTSQYSVVTDQDLDTILNASQQLMAPYSPNNAKMTISQIKIDGNGVSTVDWSRGKNVSGLTKDAAFTLPASIKTPGTSLIVASIEYNYQPTLGASLIGTIPMRDQIILHPRSVASITRTTS